MHRSLIQSVLLKWGSCVSPLLWPNTICVHTYVCMYCIVSVWYPTDASKQVFKLLATLVYTLFKDNAEFFVNTSPLLCLMWPLTICLHL